MFKTRWCVVFYSMSGDNLDCEFYNNKNEAFNVADNWLTNQWKKYGVELYAEITNLLSANKKSYRVNLYKES